MCDGNTWEKNGKKLTRPAFIMSVLSWKEKQEEESNVLIGDDEIRFQ